MMSAQESGCIYILHTLRPAHFSVIPYLIGNTNRRKQVRSRGHITCGDDIFTYTRIAKPSLPGEVDVRR
ncbi:hypothetical protein SCLCIDRAFT_736008 [Scleroderma citrinum Foug A]|uniref:Uncharacterized protein n=1 Tax=Scleroderma citrinum Foug A TaxID=1036808 RepID=A0A0C3DSS7_9AGAM|nr:hypothetical protein SCLCIDRAFT_736008 [Scleroderma citrinum Foug A]